MAAMMETIRSDRGQVGDTAAAYVAPDRFIEPFAMTMGDRQYGA
ncbi:hypothetical protein [Nocardioides immobilis]|nr:hypothetical protein [Nocardioides immobilis]